MEVLLLQNRVEAFFRFNGSCQLQKSFEHSSAQSIVLVSDVAIFNKLIHQHLIRFARSPSDELVGIACPDQASAALDFILPWARMCRFELVRQFQVKGDMALAQTVGGGWASVQNVRESLRWALILKHLADQIGDEGCKRKCDVFIGWAHLWNGNKQQSLKIFEQKLKDSIAFNDEVNSNRCVAALSHARENPLFANRDDSVPLPKEIVDQSPETLIQQAIQRINTSSTFAYIDPSADLAVNEAVDVDLHWRTAIL